MIWFTLALFVVSFVLTALLAPEPNIENARPDQLNPETFPRATEDAPIPLVLGKVRMESPNTTWWGNFSSVAITERIKVSLFKKKTIVVGHNYYLSIDLALAMGPETVMTAIYVDDKEFWTGTTNATSVTAISASDSSFFGGYKSGGGFSINGTYYPGSLDLAQQPVNAALEGHVGVGNVPAYLGTAHLYANLWLGESAQLRKIAFVLESYTNGLGLTGAGKIGEDMNPAEAIFQIMTDTWRGMGISTLEIDVPALQAMGETLYTEGNGCSVLVTAETNGKGLITEILRQVDGVAYQDPATGKIKFILIRDDYNVDDLPLFDANDIVKVKEFARSGWDEVMAQVKISFPQRDKESNAVAISQDLATVATIGRLRSTTLSMPFVYDPDLANDIASRERAQLSIPLFRITLEMNRNASVLRPGSVFKMDWPEYGFTNLVLRVQEFDLGELLDGRIVVKCLQDSFALNQTVFAAPTGSSWVAPVTRPTNIVLTEALEAPYVLSRAIEFPLVDGEVTPIVFAKQPSSVSESYTVAGSDTPGDASPSYEPENALYLGAGQLDTEYHKSEGELTGQDTTTGLSVEQVNWKGFSVSPSLPDIRSADAGLLYMDGEWLGYTSATDNGSNQWTIENVYRGLFGTTPKTHAIGTKVWEFNFDMITNGNLIIAEGGTVYFTPLDRVGAIVQSVDDIIELNEVLNDDIANRPLRPRNLQYDGSRTFTVDAVDATLTWVSSNREENDVAIELDASQVPDQAETYDVYVTKNGVAVPGLTALGVTSPHVLPLAANYPGPTSDGEIRVFARRTVGDLRVSSGYAMLTFEIIANKLLLSGDMQSGTDRVLLSGDAQSGTDVIELSGDEA